MNSPSRNAGTTSAATPKSAAIDWAEMLAAEYRRSMDADTVHDWAVDAVAKVRELNKANRDLLTTLAEIAAKANLAARTCDDDGRAAGFWLLEADARAAIAKALAPQVSQPIREGE